MCLPLGVTLAYIFNTSTCISSPLLIFTSQVMESNRIVQFPNQFYIDSGNLLASESLKRKATQVPSEEFIQGLELALSQWKLDGCQEKMKNDSHSTNDGQPFIIFNRCLYNQGNPTDRDGCKISVKVFIYTGDGSPLMDCVNYMLKKFNTSYIDTLIVSLPSLEVKYSIDQIKPYWSVAEKIARSSLVKEIGISDLDINQLKDVYNFAQYVKPTTNQIRLDSCCVVPEEMKSFAQTNGIKLLTHSDNKDFMPLNNFNLILDSCGINDADKWTRFWIARYVVIQKGNGVVQSKGYVLSIKK